MSAATELWAVQFPLGFLPALDHPMKNFGLLGDIAQVGYMFGGEGWVWRVGGGE